MKYISLLLLFYIYLLNSAEGVIRCRQVRPLNYYLQSRGGGLKVSECVALVLSDSITVNGDGIHGCDSIVVDISTSESSALLNMMKLTKPSVSLGDFRVTNMIGSKGLWFSKSKKIFMANPGSNGLVKLYKNVFSSSNSYGDEDILLSVFGIDDNPPNSRSHQAAVAARDWLRDRYFGDSTDCPLRIIFTVSDHDLFNIALDTFAEVFSKNPIHLRSQKQDEYRANALADVQDFDSNSLGFTISPLRPSQPPSRPPRPPRPSQTPSVPLLRDLDIYSSSACPTMQNLFSYADSINDKDLSYFTSVSEHVSLYTWPDPEGPFGCEGILLDVDSQMGKSIANQMGYILEKPDHSQVGLEIFTGGNSQLWYGSIKNLYYYSYSSVKRRYAGESLKKTLSNYYLRVFQNMVDSKLSEIVLYPIGFEYEIDLSDFLSAELTASALGYAIQKFISTTPNIHVVILVTSADRKDLLYDTIKSSLLRVNVRQTRYNGKQKDLVSALYIPEFNSFVDSCGSSAPISELINANFEQDLPTTSTAHSISFVNINFPPGLPACDCVLLDMASKEQALLIKRLGGDFDLCRGLSSSEYKVSLTETIKGSWFESIRKIFCLNSDSFLESSKKNYLDNIYKRVLMSARYRCSSILMPFVGIDVTNYPSYNRDLVLSTIRSVDKFVVENPDNSKLQITFFEKDVELFLQATNTLASYYLGPSRTIASKNMLPSGSVIKGLKLTQLDVFNRQEIARDHLLSKSRVPESNLREDPALCGKTKPKRPPLPLFTSNIQANRPAPSESTSKSRQKHILRSEYDCKTLKSINKLVVESDFNSLDLLDFTNYLFLINTVLPPGPKNCDALVLDINDHYTNEILFLMNQRTPQVTGEVIQVVANYNFNANRGDIIDKLSRAYLADTSKFPDEKFYVEVVKQAIINQEKSILFRIYNLQDIMLVSRSFALNRVISILLELDKLVSSYASSIKIIVYEPNPKHYRLLKEIFFGYAKGRFSN